MKHTWTSSPPLAHPLSDVDLTEFPCACPTLSSYRIARRHFHREAKAVSESSTDQQNAQPAMGRYYCYGRGTSPYYAVNSSEPSPTQHIRSRRLCPVTSAKAKKISSP